MQRFTLLVILGSSWTKKQISFILNIFIQALRALFWSTLAWWYPLQRVWIHTASCRSPVWNWTANMHDFPAVL